MTKDVDIDDIEHLIKQYSPNILDDQFCKVCYEIFLTDERGKLLIAHLFNEYVYRPFSNILDKEPSYDTNKILARAVQRDFVQGLLLRAQSYQEALKQKSEN